jgi:dCMP deaminase
LNTKYPYIVHAEASAIIQAKKDLSGCTLYVTLGSCYNCAKLIADSGISHVYYIDDKYKDDPEFKASTKIFKSCHVSNTKIKL